MAQRRSLTTFAVDWITFSQVCPRKVDVSGIGTGDIVYQKRDNEDDDAAGFTLFFSSQREQNSRAAQPRRFNRVSRDNSVTLHLVIRAFPQKPRKIANEISSAIFRGIKIRLLY